MSVKFGEVRRIGFGTRTVVVLAIAANDGSWTSDEGTASEVSLLVLDRSDLAKDDLLAESQFYPLHGTATCHQGVWNDGEVLE